MTDDSLEENKMTAAIAIIIGAFIGAPIGFFTCSLVAINRRYDALPGENPRAALAG
jgi:Na+/H+ antiporter NhaA